MTQLLLKVKVSLHTGGLWFFTPGKTCVGCGDGFPDVPLVPLRTLGQVIFFICYTVNMKNEPVLHPPVC